MSVFRDRPMSVSSSPRRASKMDVRLFGPDGTQLGDQLTDNAYEDDGYRYPRRLPSELCGDAGLVAADQAVLRGQADSDPKVREVEDAGRATVIEEAISAFVFDYGRDEQFPRRCRACRLLLAAAIIRLVSRLEVRDRSAHEWEQTILRGFAVWRELYAARGGTVHLDLEARTIEFEPTG